LIIHEDWKHDNDNYDADIALDRLETEVDLSQPQFVKIVSLPTESQSVVTGDGTVVSFTRSGADDEEQDTNPNELTLPVLS
jgi:hypothetical protein